MTVSGGNAFQSLTVLGKNDSRWPGVGQFWNVELGRLVGV